MIKVLVLVPFEKRFAPIRPMEYLLQSPTAFGRQIQYVPIKSNGLPEPNNKNSLSMLRDEMLAIDHAIVDVVPELMSQRSLDNFERPTFVMRSKVLYVLEEKRSRALLRNDS